MFNLEVSGKEFEYFSQFNLALQFNSVSSVFSFDCLIETQEQKEIFKPLSYNNVRVKYSNELLLTGTILNTSTSAESSKSLGNISGYSKTGVLEDCEIPISLYPLQSDGLSLKQITEKLIRPFGINLIVDSTVLVSANKKYDIITADADQSIIDYIVELAKQRDIIVTHNELGYLRFTKLNTKLPSIATYTEGMPVTKIILSVNGQGIHSQITVQKQATIDVDVSGEKTLSNIMVGKFRPTVKKQTAGNNSDTENTANIERAAELRNIKLTIETDRWKWTDGKKISIIKPNNIIEVQSPSNCINSRTRFFVEKVDYKSDENGINAILTCVLPEVYTGETPKNIFA